MGAEAPQWLYASFVDTMEEIGASASRAELDAEARELVERWSSSDRCVHTVRHLMTTLAHLDELASTAHDPDLLRVAAWYHGVVLNRSMSVRMRNEDPVTGEIECLSLTRTHLLRLGVSTDIVDRVVELMVFLAKNRAPRDDLDAQVLIDADLAFLAASPQEYKKHRELLRTELSDMHEVEYLTARAFTIRRLLSFDSIYQSPLGKSWESAARSNLEVELAKIDAALQAFGANDSDVDDDAVSIEASEDDASVTTTLIIKRRPVKKTPCTDSTKPRSEEFSSTGILPKMAPSDDEVQRGEDPGTDDSASSLENAIEALD